MKYQGKNCTIVRDAKEGDPGFDAAKGAQVWVRFDDGTEVCAMKSDVTEAAPAKPAAPAV
jgi:hypothetical protein